MNTEKKKVKVKIFGFYRFTFKFTRKKITFARFKDLKILMKRDVTTDAVDAPNKLHLCYICCSSRSCATLRIDSLGPLGTFSHTQFVHNKILVAAPFLASI